MTHPLNQHQFCAFDILVGIDASCNRNQRIIGAVNDESRELPTLVIHGTDDPLVPVTGGIDTHENIEGAELMLIEGMGHDLPRETWNQIVDGIASLTRGEKRAD